MRYVIELSTLPDFAQYVNRFRVKTRAHRMNSIYPQACSSHIAILDRANRLSSVIFTSYVYAVSAATHPKIRVAVITRGRCLE